MSFSGMHYSQEGAGFLRNQFFSFIISDFERRPDASDRRVSNVFAARGRRDRADVSRLSLAAARSFSFVRALDRAWRSCHRRAQYGLSKRTRSLERHCGETPRERARSLQLRHRASPGRPERRGPPATSGSTPSKSWARRSSRQLGQRLSSAWKARGSGERVARRRAPQALRSGGAK